MYCIKLFCFFFGGGVFLKVILQFYWILIYFRIGLFWCRLSNRKWGWTWYKNVQSNLIISFSFLYRWIPSIALRNFGAQSSRRKLVAVKTIPFWSQQLIPISGFYVNNFIMNQLTLLFNSSFASNVWLCRHHVSWTSM